MPGRFGCRKCHQRPRGCLMRLGAVLPAAGSRAYGPSRLCLQFNPAEHHGVAGAGGDAHTPTSLPGQGAGDTESRKLTSVADENESGKWIDSDRSSVQWHKICDLQMPIPKCPRKSPVTEVPFCPSNPAFLGLQVCLSCPPTSPDLNPDPSSAAHLK